MLHSIKILTQIQEFSMSKKIEKEKVSLFLTGDKDTIVKLYEVLYPKVILFVKSNNGTQNDAEEIFQDALFQIIARSKVKTLEIRSSLEAYIFVTCRNLWYKELNKRSRLLRNDEVFELEDRQQDELESILQQERWDLFEDSIKKLSQSCAELLKDYFNKVSYKAIVRKFNYATENTAFQRVFKCKKQLIDIIQTDPRHKNLSEK